jgi:C4-dicarboxylate-specific signal transduction histidine kinase
VPSFVSAYLGIVLVAATVEGLGNAVVNAVLVAVAHCVLTHWGAPIRLTFETTSQLVFFFVISLFLGHVAESSRKDAAERRRAEDDRRETERALQDTSTELQASSAQLQRARESLQAQERLAALGMLAAGIAHEMRNPLAAMVGNLQEAPGLLDEVAGGEEAAPAVDELRSIVRDCRAACDHLARIASDLTGMVREGHARNGTAAVRVALESAARMLRVRAQGRVEVYVECATGRPVRADPGHVLQILLNLGGNGIDAMESDRGLLTLRAEDEGAEAVALVVRDTGPGIPDDVLRRMYEPFFTTKAPGKGTGLGLHLVSEIVKASGGSIRCTTAVGQGAEFRVLLPAAPMVDEGGDDELEALPRAPPRGRRGDHPQGARTHAAQGAV